MSTVSKRVRFRMSERSRMLKFLEEHKSFSSSGDRPLEGMSGSGGWRSEYVLSLSFKTKRVLCQENSRRK